MHVEQSKHCQRSLKQKMVRGVNKIKEFDITNFAQWSDKQGHLLC